MQSEVKYRDNLPDHAASLDEIAEFWDTHDTTDYLDAFVDADITFDIKQRTYQVEVEQHTFELMQKRAAALNIPTKKVINAALKKELAI